MCLLRVIICISIREHPICVAVTAALWHNKGFYNLIYRNNKSDYSVCTTKIAEFAGAQINTRAFIENFSMGMLTAQKWEPT